MRTHEFKKNMFCFALTAAAVRIGYEEHMPGQVSVTHSAISRIIDPCCVQRYHIAVPIYTHCGS